MDAVDLFAGPGGWDVAADALGFLPLGVEHDAAACATRHAAGHRTLQADVSKLDPLEHGPCELLIASPPCPTFSSAGDRAGTQVAGVVYRCLDQLAAGHDGREAARLEALEAILPTAKTPERARRDAEMTVLVVEPLRWILALRPRLVALEQVPPVLPVWEHLAGLLRGHGYDAWCGILSAEQYGVPQTRSRAILMARLDGPVVPPPPTHQRYFPAPREPGGDRLFDPGPRARIVQAGDEELLPWVSMAEALGWGFDRRPCVTVVGGQSRLESEGQGGARPPLDGGTGARRAIADAQEAGDWRVGFPRRDEHGDGYRDRDLRDGGEPAGAVTKAARSASRVPAAVELVNGNQPNTTVRDLDEPAPTIAFGHNAGGVAFVQRERSGGRAEEGFDPAGPSQAVTSKARCWRVRTHNFTAIARDPDGQRSRAGSVPYERDADDPAPTVDTGTGGWKVEIRCGGDRIHEGFDPEEAPSQAVATRVNRLQVTGPEAGLEPEQEWPAERPSPTLTGTRKGVAGHQLPDGQRQDVGGWPGERPSTTVAGDPRIPEPGHKGYGERNAIPQMRNAVRITIEEAATLQGFPPGYPWQGSRTKTFEQIGNAVPPPLAYHVLRALLA